MQRQGIIYPIENIRKGFTEKAVFKVWLTVDEMKCWKYIQNGMI